MSTAVLLCSAIHNRTLLSRRMLIQYFQNARMEWQISKDGSYSVHLGHLGEALNFATPGIAEPSRLGFTESLLLRDGTYSLVRFPGFL